LANCCSIDRKVKKKASSWRLIRAILQRHPGPS
jgi:hypothetical protein